LSTHSTIGSIIFRKISFFGHSNLFWSYVPTILHLTTLHYPTASANGLGQFSGILGPRTKNPVLLRSSRKLLEFLIFFNGAPEIIWASFRVPRVPHTTQGVPRILYIFSQGSGNRLSPGSRGCPVLPEGVPGFLIFILEQGSGNRIGLVQGPRIAYILEQGSGNHISLVQHPGIAYIYFLTGLRKLLRKLHGLGSGP